MTRFLSLLAAGILTFMGASPAVAEPGQDHPLVSRFAGATLLESKVREFDAYTLILGKFTQGKFARLQELEGKVTINHYNNPANRTTLEIARSFQNALQQGGFQILFTCAQLDCADYDTNQNKYTATIGDWCIGSTFCEGGDTNMRYVAAKLSRPTGDVYVAIRVAIGSFTPGTWVNVVEIKPMQTGNVTVNAAGMASAISSTGHASIYGIQFDTGKATLKPESDATLAEISKLLASNTQLKLHVVGHTDNVGTAPANMLLSKQRADAVVAALVTRHHVEATRLQASGVGPLAPIDTNQTEDGRAKNRRVELVQQ